MAELIREMCVCTWFVITIILLRILCIQNHEMKNLIPIGILSLVARFASGQECPELPDTGVNMGDPVPMRPEDIPVGCSDFEILVGKLSWYRGSVLILTVW